GYRERVGSIGFESAQKFGCGQPGLRHAQDTAQGLVGHVAVAIMAMEVDFERVSAPGAAQVGFLPAYEGGQILADAGSECLGIMHVVSSVESPLRWTNAGAGRWGMSWIRN